MDGFTSIIFILLILSIINNFVMYYNMYNPITKRDPLLPNNIGVIKYDVYYNVETNRNENIDDMHLDYAKIPVKEDLDQIFDAYQNKNPGKYLILNNRPTNSDYRKIMAISKTEN